MPETIKRAIQRWEKWEAPVFWEKQGGREPPGMRKRAKSRNGLTAAAEWVEMCLSGQNTPAAPRSGAARAESDLSFPLLFGYHRVVVGWSNEESSSGSIET
jgi:hypothetical protein